MSNSLANTEVSHEASTLVSREGKCYCKLKKKH